jgi:putative transposase
MRIDDVYRKKCKRLNFTGQAHELTFSCYQNQNFLKSPRICWFLIDAINTARQKHDFSLWAYVFMPNHVHLIIFPRKSPYSIAAILRSIKQSVSRRAINYLFENNPAGLRKLATGQSHPPYRFWQAGGGYDRNIVAVDTLVTAIQYIHNNPVRKSLVAIADDWLYSSIRDWNNQTGPLSVDFDDYPLK